MISAKHLLFVFAALIFSLGSTAAETNAGAAQLSAVYDGLHVEQLWLAGHKVNWKTGEAISNKTGKTHCSAFVAAACMKLGIYILRPPEHPADMLANAQMHWLGEHGGEHGWKSVATPAEAQALANSGVIVVVVYENPDPKKSGHIALVRPSEKSAAEIEADGPQVIQAGSNNHESCSVREGFRHHKAWNDAHDFTVRFYANKNIRDCDLH